MLVLFVSTLDSAKCWTGNTAPLVDLDFGIAVISDNAIFTADPSGVLQLDATNTGSAQAWDAGMAACTSAGKRMPGTSSLKAFYEITPVGSKGLLTTSNYWSSTVNPASSTYAYQVGMHDGYIGPNVKNSITVYVRCGR